MKLVEGTRNMRRLDLYGSNEYVDCLMCGVPSDSEDGTVTKKMTRKQANQGIHLDRLMILCKGKHREALLVEGRSLVDLGFTSTRAVEAT